MTRPPLPRDPHESMRRLVRTPARDRLEWLMDGLDGRPGWGADASDVLAEEFTSRIPAQLLLDVTRARAAKYAPLTLAGIEVDEYSAQARLRTPEGSVDIAHCVVEPEPPHRITLTWVQPLVPTDLTPRLPMDFTGHPVPSSTSQRRVVVFSGVPGSGKSTLADAVGEALGVPVFALDWLLGALTPFGGRHLHRAGEIGTELLSTLAVRQLSLGQSVILDAPTEEDTIRHRWRTLAAAAGAEFSVVTCVCGDEDVHRSRVEGRSRGIPGWYDAGDWTDVRRRLARFTPWPEAHVVDTSRPHADNLADVLGHIARRSG